MARPYLRTSQPMPPPRVSPAMPTEPVSPKGVASPCAAAAVVYSRAVRPAPAHAEPPLRIDVQALQRGHVDDDAAVDGAVAGEAVAAAADGDLECRSAAAKRTASATSCRIRPRGRSSRGAGRSRRCGSAGPRRRRRCPGRAGRRAAASAKVTGSMGSDGVHAVGAGRLPRPCSLAGGSGGGARDGRPATDGPGQPTGVARLRTGRASMSGLDARPVVRPGVRPGRPARLAPEERRGLRRQRRVPEDQVGRLLGEHHHRRVDVAVGDVGHRRRVDDAEPVEPVDAHRRAGRGPTSPSTPIRAVHDGWSAVSASRATQSRISSSVVDGRARRGLAAVVGVHRRLAEDAPGDADGLDPLPAVLVGREVVEAQRRVLVRVGALERDRCRAHPSTSARRAPGSRVRARRRCRRSGSRAAGSGTSGSGRRRRRCCARTRRPRSGWWRPGRSGGTATARR